MNILSELAEFGTYKKSYNSLSILRPLRYWDIVAKVTYKIILSWFLLCDQLFQKSKELCLSGWRQHGSNKFAINVLHWIDTDNVIRFNPFHIKVAVHWLKDSLFWRSAVYSLVNEVTITAMLFDMYLSIFHLRTLNSMISFLFLLARSIHCQAVGKKNWTLSQAEVTILCA